jgi:hypothetical protein
MSYEVNRAWSDKYLDQITAEIGKLIIKPSSRAMDIEQATDLVCTVPDGFAVAARLRRPDARKYIGEFTIRASGTVSEYDKILSGQGASWLFYGHMDESGELEAWWVIDLALFKATAPSIEPIRRKGFFSFKLTDFPLGMVVASHLGRGGQSLLQLRNGQIRPATAPATATMAA